MLTGAGLERKSPQTSPLDTVVYIVLRDGTQNSRTHDTATTAWVGPFRTAKFGAQLNHAPKLTAEIVTRPLEVIRSRPLLRLLNRCHAVRGGLTQSYTSETNPPQGETW